MNEYMNQTPSSTFLFGGAELPKGENPRPQMVRTGGEVRILNGLWQCAFAWTGSSEYDSREYDILVPFSPETKLSGVLRTLRPYEFLHYYKEFILEEEDSALQGDMGILLHFGAVDQECRVYVNGKTAGEHKGGYLSFSMDITPWLKCGKNEIHVVVRDQSEEMPYARGKQKYVNHGPLSSIFYPCQSGIWKTVWMEWVPVHYINRVSIRTDYDQGQVRIGWKLANVHGKDASTANQKEMRIEVYDAVLDRSVKRGADERMDEADSCWGVQITKKNVKLAEITAGEEDGVVILQLDNFHPWTCEEPYLYPVRLTMAEDTVDTYFGMRCMTVEKDRQGISRMCLNHRPIFLNGVLDQGYWPDSLLTAPTDAALQDDIWKMRSMGYNTLRKHVKVEEERFYYHCDRLGMLVIQDMPNGGGDYNMYFQAYLPNGAGNLVRGLSDRDRRLFRREDRDGRRQFLQELKGMIGQLRNHPSIVAWVPFNEGWGQFDASRVSKLVKRWDPDRLVNEACGWFDQGGGDFYSIHNYFRKLKVRPQGERVVALTEYGGFSYPAPEHGAEQKEFGYRHYKDAEEVTANYEKVWKEQILPAIPCGLSCAIYTQVSDICEEQNGLLTYDREEYKVDPERIRRVHDRLKEYWKL